MERAAARSGPSSKMLEWGRSGSDDLFFFMAGIVTKKLQIPSTKLQKNFKLQIPNQTAGCGLRLGV
jgi:hypothetical protein